MILRTGRYASWVVRIFRRSFLFVVSVTYILFVLFALFNYRSHCIFTHPESLIRLHLLSEQEAAHICKVNWGKLGVQKIDIFKEHDLKEIAKEYPFVDHGGQYKPTKCQSYQKVAIVIPYRDRMHHFKMLLNRLHLMLWKQNIEYRIFVIEQAGQDRFNRGKLMNVGFKEALKIDDYDCFVFHDVDLIPENDKNLYICDDHVRQLSSAIDEMRYHVMYYNYAGGVIAIKRDTFRKLNGYANSYWGWGNEDDDLSARIQEGGFLLTRPPEYIGRFKMIRHKKEDRAEHGYDNFLGWRGRWMKDGLNTEATMNYTMIKITKEQLYTNLTVDLGPSKGHMIDPALDTTKESLGWFLKFYFP